MTDTTTPDQGDERRATYADAIRLAKLFHQTYEELAPEFGYETRPETREFKHDSANGALMVEVMRRLLPALSAAQPVAQEASGWVAQMQSAKADANGRKVIWHRSKFVRTKHDAQMIVAQWREQMPSDVLEYVIAEVWTGEPIPTRAGLPALAAPQPSQGAQPVVDQKPASMSDNGSCGSQVSGKPVAQGAIGTFNCPICGNGTPHHHSDFEQVQAMSEEQIDAELRALGIDPDKAAQKVKVVIDHCWAEYDRRLKNPLAAPQPSQGAEDSNNSLYSVLAECRDAFPMPERGSDLESLWAQAMGDPYSVSDYIIAAVASLSTPSALPAQAVGEKESVEPWVDGNGVIRTGVLPDATQEAAEMTEEAVRLWLAQRGRMSVPRSDYLKAIAPASLREAQIQAVASAVDSCEERGCKECAGMLRGEIHRLRAWDFKDSRSAPQEAGKAEGECPGCGGLGRIRVLRCEQCDGTGRILASPSKEAGKVEAVADEPFGWFSAFRDGSEDFMRRTDSQPAPAYEEEPTHCIALYAHPSPQALSDEEIIDLARVASTVNNYSNGRFASAIFEREHAIAFARAILAAAGGSEK